MSSRDVTLQPQVFAGRYELLSLLGEGGMGRVYRVRDRELAEVIALKTILPQRTDPDILERFKDEVRLARRVTHPNVLRIYDLGVFEGTPYFTMEYLDGGSLRDLIDRGPIELSKALGYLKQIAEGLTAAHACGVVHRDLKPSNVMFGPNGRLALGDFGIALREGVADRETTGTPGYMAPEQEGGRETDASADLFAFGVVAMEMLRGCEPTRQVQQLIARCREIDPLLRPTAAEVVRELSNVAPTQAAPPPHEAPTLREQRRERTLAVLRPTVLGQAIDPGVAEAFTAELIDALTRCHELKVTGLGAVARFADARDPHQIGRELRVELVVDPTLMIVGDRVRVDARVLEVHSGFQVFRGRFEDGLDGLLQLQEVIAARIAEALRVAIIAATSRGSAPGEVMGLYLKARSALNRFELSGPNGALALLDACLAKAPYFKPGLACQAHARVRAWFAPQTLTSDLESRAREAVEQCLEHAPELPESQLSAALWQTQLGNYREAVLALNRALAAAPMCAPAHELLALLELESGRLRDGLERGRMALSLDPTLTATWVMLALREALVSREGFERWAAQPPAELRDTMQLKAMRLRAGVWFRDQALQRAAIEELRGKGPLASDLWLVYGAVAAGQQTSDLNATMARLEQQLGANPRRGSFWCALLVEAFATSGRVKEALVWLERASQTALLDLDWMMRCPCLDHVRAAPEFEAIRARVQQRVDQVWA